MKNEIIPDDDDRLRHLLVPVVSTTGGVILLNNGDAFRTAIVRLDASRRPDVADLARVIETDSIERIDKHPSPRYLMPPNPGLLEHLRFRDPVICEFTFFIPWEENEEFFETAVQGGMMTVTFKETSDVREGITFRINASELDKVVRAWRLVED